MFHIVRKSYIFRLRKASPDFPGRQSLRGLGRILGEPRLWPASLTSRSPPETRGLDRAPGRGRRHRAQAARRLGSGGACPFHDDRTPSLVASPEKNLWRCLGACGAGCSAGGDNYPDSGQNAAGALNPHRGR
ncbi:MAG TPA: CHC2 zinc finger domain-containing protein [Wenzhouxiangella sp.]|nr:CHC2 zinc finger domain-containing protein [Wenzhouxiangella sp.]